MDGGRGKPGENIRPAAKRVEPEERKDTEFGTVTIHHRPTEEPSVRATSGRGRTVFVTFMDVQVLPLRSILMKLLYIYIYIAFICSFVKEIIVL